MIHIIPLDSRFRSLPRRHDLSKEPPFFISSKWHHASIATNLLATSTDAAYSRISFLLFCLRGITSQNCTDLRFCKLWPVYDDVRMQRPSYQWSTCVLDRAISHRREVPPDVVCPFRLFSASRVVLLFTEVSVCPRENAVAVTPAKGSHC